jgi:hypothetical protein
MPSPSSITRVESVQTSPARRSVELVQHAELEQRLRWCEGVLELVRDPDASVEQRLDVLERALSRLLAELALDELEHGR